MHTVKNISKESQAFWADDDQGARRLVRLEPGESQTLIIDPNQPRFAEGGPLEVTQSRKQAADTEPKASPKA